MNEPIYHLASLADAQALESNGPYDTASLASEGFIHCCTCVQLPGVIQRYYADADSLIILTIDREQLTSKLVFENTVGGEELFPHVYGQINSEAVTNTLLADREKIQSIAQSVEYRP